MINKLWDKRIPTFLGIILIAFSVILTSIFIKDRTIFKSSAIAIDDPQNITITNISDTSFVLSYTTEANVTGTVNFGENTNLGLTEIEDIDRQKGIASPRMIHVTTLNNLTPNTKYYFVINSGQTTFLKNNVPFEVETGPIIPTPTFTQTPIKGNVILPEASSNQTIAYLIIKGAQTLSTLVNNDGSFSFSLDSLRSEDLSSYFQLDIDSNIKITFVSDSFVSRVLSLYSQTDPLPTITLPNNYDFTIENSPIASASGGMGFQEIFPSLPSEKNATKSPTTTPSSASAILSLIITPTSTPAPTPTPDIASINQVPPTGDSNILLIVIAAIFITAIGIVLFLLTRSKTTI